MYPAPMTPMRTVSMFSQPSSSRLPPPLNSHQRGVEFLDGRCIGVVKNVDPLLYAAGAFEIGRGILHVLYVSFIDRAVEDKILPDRLVHRRFLLLIFGETVDHLVPIFGVSDEALSSEQHANHGVDSVRVLTNEILGSDPDRTVVGNLYLGAVVLREVANIAGADHHTDSLLQRFIGPWLPGQQGLDLASP